jgi:3-deoxy-manno-octulosonate cytidylyltransferase (CMP-KDO synthetase)
LQLVNRSIGLQAAEKGAFVRVIAVIPARYESSRFPGKPLARQTGKYLIQHVYEQVSQARQVNDVLVATDDQRILAACKEFGAKAVMTSRRHTSGTDRVAEVAAQSDADIVVNVQGDEPEIDPGSIDRAIDVFSEDDFAAIATLAAVMAPHEDINDPNVVKVVTDASGHALYFSRWPIPFHRDGQPASRPVYRKHLGLYAYRRESLMEFSRQVPTPLEKAEKLEQLRALENGMVIAVRDVEHTAVGIDTPEQYAAFVRRCEKTKQSAF